MVCDRWTNFDWICIFKTSQIHHSAHCLRHDIIAGSVCQWPILSKSGTGCIDNGWIDLLYRLIINPQLLCNPATIILNKNICILYQIIKSSAFLFQISGLMLHPFYFCLHTVKSALSALFINWTPCSALISV